MKRIIVLFISLALLAACQTPLRENGAEPRLHCEAYYRSSATSEGQAQSSTNIFELSPDEKDWSGTFLDMVLIAKYHDDEYEGRGLQIVVSDLNSGRQLASYLYQFQVDKLPVNQFLGGHGFTGLAYIYHPESPSELQFFCKIQ
jgi:hypothetical protein